MGKSIYTYYKERLIEIGGKNKCLYLKNIVRKSAFDIGKIFEGRDDKVNELLDFLWTGSKEPLVLIRKEESRDFGIRLLYLLLIEPYRLIYSKFERNRKEVRKA